MGKLPLYTVVSEGIYSAIRVSASYRKGPLRVVISERDHTVGLKVGDTYYAQQFGNSDQAVAKYKEIKTTIRDGGDL